MARKQESADSLRSILKPGNTIYTVLKHVSRPGSRCISLHVIVNNEPICIDWHVANLLGERVGNHGGIVVNGCGMDMGFDVVYNLGRLLYPEGVPCAGKFDPGRCRSNDHVNPGPDRDKYDPKIIHRDGGYAFNHRWL